MAFLFLTRCFLLLLLASDWAGDPYHGQSPLSHNRASQIYCCHSIRPALASMNCMDGMVPVHAGLPLPLVPLPLPNSSRIEAAALPNRIPAAKLIYLFMSLQR